MPSVQTVSGTNPHRSHSLRAVRPCEPCSMISPSYMSRWAMVKQNVVHANPVKTPISRKNRQKERYLLSVLKSDRMNFRLCRLCELRTVQIRIETILCKQVIVRALFDDIAVLYEQMGDDETECSQYKSCKKCHFQKKPTERTLLSAGFEKQSNKFLFMQSVRTASGTNPHRSRSLRAVRHVSLAR